MSTRRGRFKRWLLFPGSVVILLVIAWTSTTLTLLSGYHWSHVLVAMQAVGTVVTVAITVRVQALRRAIAAAADPPVNVWLVPTDDAEGPADCSYVDLIDALLITAVVRPPCPCSYRRSK
jgi:hypothetical protein